MGEFGVCLVECVYAVFGTVWCGDGGLRFYCVWDSLVCVREVILCCLWKRCLWFWVSKCLLCVEEIGVGLGSVFGAGGLVLDLCLCVFDGIVWLWLDGIKCLLL